MYEWVKNLFEEIENDILDQTKEDYDAGDLITLQNLLIYDLCKIVDHYHMSDINIDDYVALKFAVKDMIRKISWALYHGSYRDMKWIEEFHRSYEAGL